MYANLIYFLNNEKIRSPHDDVCEKMTIFTVYGHFTVGKNELHNKG
jgi:hypothetical protein